MSESESETPKTTLSRRDLLKRTAGKAKRTALTAAGVATFNVVANPGILEAQSEFPVATPLEYEDFSLGNDMLRVVMTEHTEADWNANQERLMQEIANASTVIPEYLPYEYKHLQHSLNPLYWGVRSYNANNALFEHLADLCVKQKKPMWVVDPEYNEQGVSLRSELLSPTLLAEFASAMTTVESVKKTMNGQLTRRQLMQRIIIAAGAALGVAVTDISLGLLLEDDIRHVISAELINQLYASQRITKGTADQNTQQKATMFIPKVHWNGIKSYLTNPEARREMLNLYLQLFGKQFSTIFEARFHPGGDASGTPKDKISLLK